MKVRWLEIYINISLQLQEFTVSLLQFISYVQLHLTHTKEVEIALLSDQNVSYIYLQQQNLLYFIIPYVQLYWTHTKKVEILIEKSDKCKERSYLSLAIKHQVLTTVQNNHPWCNLGQKLTKSNQQDIQTTTELTDNVLHGISSVTTGELAPQTYTAGSADRSAE